MLFEKYFCVRDRTESPDPDAEKYGEERIDYFSHSGEDLKG
jgi:hypothetical protein